MNGILRHTESLAAASDASVCRTRWGASSRGPEICRHEGKPYGYGRRTDRSCPSYRRETAGIAQAQCIGQGLACLQEPHPLQHLLGTQNYCWRSRYRPMRRCRRSERANWERRWASGRQVLLPGGPGQCREPGSFLTIPPVHGSDDSQRCPPIPRHGHLLSCVLWNR